MIVKSYDIEKNLNKFLKYNLFLLYGENEGLKKEIELKIQTEIKNKNGSLEFFSFYESEIIANDKNFYNSVFSESLFSNKKMVIIKNASDKIINHLNEIVEKYPENLSLIVFAGILEKKSKLRNLFEADSKILCIPCYLDNDSSLENIAKNSLKMDKIILSQECINLLVEQSNGDRNNLKNEIEKIKNFTVNNKKIEIDEIRSITNFSGEYKTDSLVNDCLCGNISQYKKNLSELYANTINQIFLLRILSNKIQRLLNMKEKQNDYNSLDNLLSANKPPIFWKEKPLVKKQLSIWQIDELKKANKEISYIEMLCKKNPKFAKIIFFKFISGICKKASNFS